MVSQMWQSFLNVKAYVNIPFAYNIYIYIKKADMRMFLHIVCVSTLDVRIQSIEITHA